MAQYPLINGNRYDFSSIEFNTTAKGGVTVGLQAITYKNNLKPGIVRGTSAQKNGRTRGVYDPDASVTMYKQEADEFIAALGDGYMEATFDISIVFADTGQPLVVDEILGCRISTDGQDHKEGGDALMTTFDLDVMAIRKNGVNPIKNMRLGTI